MEPPSHSFGAPADSTRMPSSDETTNSNNNTSITTAGYDQTVLTHTTRGGPHAPSHELSSPREPARLHVYGNTTAYLYNQSLNPVSSSDTGPDHPLSPLRQAEELLQFSPWRTHQRQVYSQVPPGFAPAVGYAPPDAVFQSRASPSAPLPPSHMAAERSRFRPTDQAPVHLLQVQPSAPGTSAYHQATPYVPLSGHQLAQYNEPLSDHARPHLKFSASAPNGTYYAGASVAMQPASSPLFPATQSFCSVPKPTVQQPPTHGIVRHSSQNLKKSSRRPITSPQKIQLLRPSPDLGLFAKKEAYRLKADDYRQQREALHRQRELATKLTSLGVLGQRLTVSGGTRRKFAVQAPETYTPTATHHLRRSLVAGFQPEQEDNVFFDSYGAIYGGDSYVSPYSTSPALFPSHQQAIPPNDPMDMDTPPASEPEPINYDDFPQHITSTYKCYKWSITHFTLSSTSAFAFAQSWLEDLLAINVQAPGHSWHSHTSLGFIKDGTRHSLIVLHNAVDPFDTAISSSTTTIGVYGYHWHDHEEIHWKTIAPDIKWLLQWCENQGAIEVKGRWKPDVARASERRFHRAYWIAARREPLRGLLNHGDIGDQSHDVVEGEDEKFEVSERDLVGDWDGGSVSGIQAEEAWQRVLESNEDDDLVGVEGGGEYVVTGCSEWE